jgi:hypothetical protein
MYEEDKWVCNDYFVFRLPFREHIIYNYTPSPPAADNLAVLSQSRSSTQVQTNPTPYHAVPMPFDILTLNSSHQSANHKTSPSQNRKPPSPIPLEPSNQPLSPNLQPPPLQITHPLSLERVFLRPAGQRHAAEEGNHHRRVEAGGVVARRAGQDTEQVCDLPRQRRRCCGRLLRGRHGH